MPTKAEVLQLYNDQHMTDYADVQELGTALVKHVLTVAWIEHKKTLAVAAAEAEPVV